MGFFSFVLQNRVAAALLLLIIIVFAFTPDGDTAKSADKTEPQEISIHNERHEGRWYRIITIKRTEEQFLETPSGVVPMVCHLDM